MPTNPSQRPWALESAEIGTFASVTSLALATSWKYSKCSSEHVYILLLPRRGLAVHLPISRETKMPKGQGPSGEDVFKKKNSLSKDKDEENDLRGESEQFLFCFLGFKLSFFSLFY